MAGEVADIDLHGGHNIKQKKSGFGKSVRPKVQPTNFLKSKTGLGGTGKWSGTAELPEPTSFARKTVKPKKASVPSKTERPIMGLKTKTNFVTANAVETIVKAPKQVPQGIHRYVDKPDYGKVPSYLKKVKNNIHDEYAFIERLQTQNQPRVRGQEMELIDEDERMVILDGLRAKWNELNKKYQGLSFALDAIDKTKVRVKENLEDRLDQIEKDIAIFEKQNIFIHDGQLYY